MRRGDTRHHQLSDQTSPFGIVASRQRSSDERKAFPFQNRVAYNVFTMMNTLAPLEEIFAEEKLLQRAVPRSVSSDEIVMLRMLFDLTHRKRVTAKQRTKLMCAMEERIRALENGMPTLDGTVSIKTLRCTSFGVTTPLELAEQFVHEFEKMNGGLKSFREFRHAKKSAGYRSRVRGKLFHLFVRNFAPLNRDLYEHALRMIEELNAPTVNGDPPGRRAPSMMNSKGQEFPRRVTFGAPLKAKDVCIIKKNGKRVEFVDDMYVSYADDPEASLWGFLCQIEVKTAGAAGGLGKQISFSQIRLAQDDVEMVEMIVEGCVDPVRVRPEHIMFSQRTIDRNGVSFLGKKSWIRLGEEVRLLLSRAALEGNAEEIYLNSAFRFQATNREGVDAFRRITLAINVDFFDEYVDAIWPIGFALQSAHKSEKNTTALVVEPNALHTCSVPPES